MNHLDNKFYTPDLEEFHVGFRYEGRYANINFDEGKCTVGEWSEWTPTQYGNLDFNLYTEQRVKYLDREDIEELGWLYEGLTDDNKTEIYGGIKNYTFYRLICSNGESSIAIFKANADKGEGNLFPGKDSAGSYYLKIKNYNELKTLMKQIGIIKHE